MFCSLLLSAAEEIFPDEYFILNFSQCLTTGKISGIHNANPKTLFSQRKKKKKNKKKQMTVFHAGGDKIFMFWEVSQVPELCWGIIEKQSEKI